MKRRLLSFVRRKFFSLAGFSLPSGSAEIVHHESNKFSTFNVLKSFPGFIPYSAGTYEQRASLAIGSVNNTFSSLASLGKFAREDLIPIENGLPEWDMADCGQGELAELFAYYGSDKSTRHNYHHLYAYLLKNRNTISKILEIGLGTNNVNVVSNMTAAGRPGASLRAFSDFCPNAQIFGADIDQDVLFSEGRIKTFFLDQLEPQTFEGLHRNCGDNFDLIIDDGLHSPDANINSLVACFKLLKVNGWLVVEDIGYDAVDIWRVVASMMALKGHRAVIFQSKSVNPKKKGAIVFAVQRVFS